MIKPLIHLRKKTLLPIKWWWQRRKEIKPLEVRTKEEILKRMEEVKQRVIEFSRLNKEKERVYEAGRLNALKWTLYVRKED